jgi:hypothetical protein
LIESILSRHADTRFLVRFTKNARGEDDLRRRIDASPVGHKVEVIPSEQSHIDYLATIERSDVIVLPYSPVEYRGIVSGVFCEIAAMAKISVVPDRTWMADHVADGRAAAVLFRDNSVADMVEAVECAIRDRDRLQVVADRSASVFREEYSCERNLDGMIRLAAERSDMRLSYVPLTDATNAFGSQHYFGDGWALADEGSGPGPMANTPRSIFRLPRARRFFFQRACPSIPGEKSVTARGFADRERRGRSGLVV